MILTVTMNPSVDKRYNVEDFSLGSVYRTSQYEYTPGGKGINVAKVINDLEEDLITTGLLGGRSGEFITDELDKISIPHKFININGNTRGCLNIISKGGVQTEILESGPTISEAEYEVFLKEFENLLKDVKVVSASGSLPQGLPTNTYSDLIDITRRNNIKFILDTSGDYLREGIKARPYLIKPNEHEMEELTGKRVDDIESLIDAMESINNMGVEIVVVSLGEKGAIVSSNEKIYYGKAPNITPVNTVGSGDAMIGAMAIAIKNNLQLDEILKFGIASGTSNALELETGRVDIKNFNKFLKEIKLEEIKK